MHSICITRTLPSKGGCVARIPRFHPYRNIPYPTPPPTSTPTNECSGSSINLLSQKCTISSSVYAVTPLSMPSSAASSSSSLGRSSSTFSILPSSHVERDSQPSLAKHLTASDERSKVARCLVDRAVKMLTDAWAPVTAQTLPPSVPLAHEQSRSSTTTAATYNTTQLPSPSTPSQTPPRSPLADGPNSSGPKYPYQSTAEHMPLRQFVHEVLRRSRTSCTSLQTALCYVEAISAKLPGLLAEEMHRAEIQTASSFLEIPTEDEESSSTAASAPVVEAPATTTSVPEESEGDAGAAADARNKKRRIVPKDLPPLPPQPSPLLCPRRTFMASLLLASKFLQDRSYSNKAWAKLTGLAPREVGRCERALAEALEWRLWVGKGVNSPCSSDSMDDGGLAVPTEQPYVAEGETTSGLKQLRSLGKSKSEGDLALPISPVSTRASSTSSGTDMSAATRTWVPVASTSLQTVRRANPQTLKRSCTETALGEHLPSASLVSPALGPGLVLTRAPTEIGSGYLSSLSTPSSLLDTQSSASSVASFSEILTPPISYAPSRSGLYQYGLGLALGLGEEKSGTGFLDMQVEEIVGHA